MAVQSLSEEVMQLLSGLSCGMTNCKSNQHYFRETKKMRENNEDPFCAECGADLIDWRRVRRRDLSDVENTFIQLKYECIRHVYWHREIDQKAMNYALRKGRAKLFEAAEHRIRKYMAKPADAFSRVGTSWEGNPIHYAQHATATCCRDCMQKWHNILPEKELTEKQIQYFTKLVILYLEERLPDLPEFGQKVPAIRKKINTK